MTKEELHARINKVQAEIVALNDEQKRLNEQLADVRNATTQRVGAFNELQNMLIAELKREDEERLKKEAEERKRKEDEERKRKEEEERKSRAGVPPAVPG